MTGNDFRNIRLDLQLTQKALAGILGYSHKIRISEYERTTNPLPIPGHIEVAMLALKRRGGVAPEAWGSVREWTRAA